MIMIRMVIIVIIGINYLVILLVMFWSFGFELVVFLIRCVMLDMVLFFGSCVSCVIIVLLLLIVLVISFVFCCLIIGIDFFVSIDLLILVFLFSMMLFVGILECGRSLKWLLYWSSWVFML